MDNILVNIQSVKQKCKLIVGTPPLFVSVAGNYTTPETGNYIEEILFTKIKELNAALKNVHA